MNISCHFHLLTRATYLLTLMLGVIIATALTAHAKEGLPSIEADLLGDLDITPLPSTDLLAPPPLPDDVIAQQLDKDFDDNLDLIENNSDTLASKPITPSAEEYTPSLDLPPLAPEKLLEDDTLITPSIDATPQPLAQDFLLNQDPDLPPESTTSTAPSNNTPAKPTASAADEKQALEKSLQYFLLSIDQGLDKAKEIEKEHNANNLLEDNNTAASTKATEAEEVHTKALSDAPNTPDPLDLIKDAPKTEISAPLLASPAPAPPLKSKEKSALEASSEPSLAIPTLTEESAPSATPSLKATKKTESNKNTSPTFVIPVPVPKVSYTPPPSMIEGRPALSDNMIDNANDQGLTQTTRDALNNLDKKLPTLALPPTESADTSSSADTAPTSLRQSKHEDDLTRNAQGEIVSPSGLDIKLSDRYTQSLTTEKDVRHAYRALSAGQYTAASLLYKKILKDHPEHPDALFGLATSYHRNGQIFQAKTTYEKLLNKHPEHLEALNNYLVVVAAEAPEDALNQLIKLETSHREFSPIPAQIAMLYLQEKNYTKAEQYIKRAIILDPNNVAYLYNLAITSDHLGKKSQAMHFYTRVLEISDKNASTPDSAVPDSAESIKARLNYLQGRP